jgi:hypothetical protein
MNRHSMLATLALGLAFGSLSPAVSALPRAPSTAAAPPERAAAPGAFLEAAPKGTVVFDDDGGRAQIVPRQAVVGREPSQHGGPAISGGSIHPIFLGNAWRDPANRRREAQMLAALASRGGSATLPSLAPYRLAAPELHGPALELAAAAPRTRSLSDLQIQGRLDHLVTGRKAEPLAADAVYVVFLAPGLGSTLGTSTSERDYAAYHNHLHTAAGVVHYAVVPYDEDFARWLGAAQQALVETLINPEGNGWY